MQKNRNTGPNWVFPKIGVPQNGWFIMENPIKIDDSGVPLFLETPNCWISFLGWRLNEKRNGRPKEAEDP